MTTDRRGLMPKNGRYTESLRARLAVLTARHQFMTVHDPHSSLEIEIDALAREIAEINGHDPDSVERACSEVQLHGK
jgi:hypothetical protein